MSPFHVPGGIPLLPPTQSPNSDANHRRIAVPHTFRAIAHTQQSGGPSQLLQCTPSCCCYSKPPFQRLSLQKLYCGLSRGPGEGAGQRRPPGWGRGGEARSARGKPGVGEGMRGAGRGGAQRKKEGGGTGRGGVVFASSAHSYHSLELGQTREAAKGRGEGVT